MIMGISEVAGYMYHLIFEVSRHTPLLSGLYMELYVYILFELFIRTKVMAPKVNNKGNDKDI